MGWRDGAVGHVFRNVDGEDPRRRTSITAAYQSWTSGRPEHAVFREFINLERNNILKEYQLSVVDSAEVGVVIVDPHEEGGTDETPFILDENLFRPVTGEFGAGEDARDVYRLALEWWDAELSRLEATMKASNRLP